MIDEKELDPMIIQICPHCGKIDIDKDHYKNCEGSARYEREDNLWK